MGFVIGIDPGANGGIAAHIPSGTAGVVAYRMPATDADICDLLTELWGLKEPDESGVVFVEKVNGHGGLPGTRMFNFGQNYGLILGCLATLKAPTVLLTPQAWLKKIGIGMGEKNKTKWKNILKSEAQRRYPKNKVTLYNADALLIMSAGLECHVT